MRVIVFGTFDNLHPGHLDYFRQAMVFGQELVVIVARDSNVLRKKGRPAQEKQKIRLSKARVALKILGYPGRAVLGSANNFWSVLGKYKPDIIALGYDQDVDLERLKKEIKKFHLFSKVKRLKAYQPAKYKSSYCIKANI